MGANESKLERTLLILGKTGDGKSSTGNLILKKRTFPTESSPNSKTKNKKLGCGVVGNRNITVIDTPGIFDTSNDEEQIRKQLIQCLVDCPPEPLVLIIVQKVGRHTEQKREILTKIQEYFGDDVFKRSLVLFTHGEDLNGQTIEEFVNKSPELQELVDKCGGRCHVIDNKHWNNRIWGYKSNRVQVRNLLETIDKMVMEDSYYTNELFQTIEEEIQEEFNSTDPNLCQEERRERAKRTVFKRLLIRFVGVATGTLIGALMGIAVPVASLVALVKGAKNTFTTAKTTQADEPTSKMTGEMEEPNSGETGKAVAAMLGATAGAAIGTSSVSAAIGAAVEAGITAAAVEAGIAAAETIDHLLETTDKMAMEDSYYTNELFQTNKEEIQEEFNSTDPNLCQEERRERAKRTVFKRLLIRFVGVATGTLIGALMGIAVPVASLVALVKGAKNTFTTAKTTQADEPTSKMTGEMEEPNSGETGKAVVAMLGATAGAAIGTSSVSAAIGAAVEAGIAAAAVEAGIAAAAVEAGIAAGATAGAVGAAVEAGVAAGATAGAAAGATAAAGGAVAVEAGVAGASIGAAAGSGIAVGVVFGAAALAGAIGGAVTGYRAVEEADSVLDAIKLAAKANYKNAKGVVKKAEDLPTSVYKRF